MIECRDLWYGYEGTLVLQGLDFTIPAGAAVLLEGPNGAGKSTLLKLINGLIFPQRGEYCFAGEAITEAKMRDHRFSKAYHQRVGLVWQNPDVQLFCASVAEELAFGPQQLGLPEEEIRQRVSDALELFGIMGLRDRAPYYLSGGEKKKTAIASIFTMNPEVWTMDEPLSALDSRAQAWLVDFLGGLKLAGKTLLLATHDDSRLRQLADFRLVLTEEHRLMKG